MNRAAEECLCTRISPSRKNRPAYVAPVFILAWSDTHETVDRRTSPYEEKRGAVGSSADGPKRGRETEELAGNSVSNPSRREAARREQARRE